MPAPKIVAKGDGALAKRIVRVARDNGIPILERKPLARALFAMAEIGQEIPAALFQAMAEVLAYVYQLPNSR
jgi:flagellar biosynthetic protein FlhB